MSESGRKADFSYLELKPEDRVPALLRAFADNVMVAGEKAGSCPLFGFLQHS
jgi:hypothetical protein